MKILFTGSSGPKVGATVAHTLSGRHDLIGIDLVAAPTTTHIADISKILDWRPWLEGVDAVVHFAALHAPHRETHSRDDFMRLNVDTTARLVEAAKCAGVKRFVLASTTSVYGRAMRSTSRAVWVTEDLSPIAEDIYDESKLAAEDICREAFAPDFVTTALRFSRSFPEPLPLMALYRLYRGVDARDVAQAFACALDASLDTFSAFNISGETPFLETDCEALMTDAASVLALRCPAMVETFSRCRWSLPSAIDRVYVTAHARLGLGYRPLYGWQDALMSHR